MLKPLIIISLVLLLVSCEKSTNIISDNRDNRDNKSFNLNDTVSIFYQQTIINETENISIRFKELVSDSRCPVDLLCFWQGDADLKFTIHSIGKQRDFNLHTAWISKRDTTLLDYNIEIIDVLPHRHSDFEYHPEQYLAYLLVSKE